jgi:hypothetical protein
MVNQAGRVNRKLLCTKQFHTSTLHEILSRSSLVLPQVVSASDHLEFGWRQEETGFDRDAVEHRPDSRSGTIHTSATKKNLQWYSAT